MGGARFISACAALVLAAGCAPSNADNSQNAVSGTGDALKDAGADGSAIYLSEEVIEIGCLIAADYITAQFNKADKPLALFDGYRFDDPDWQEENASRMFAHLIDGEEGDPADSAIRARASAFAFLTKQNLFEQCPAIGAIKAKRSFIPDPKQKVPPVTPDGLFYTHDTLSVVLPLVDLDRGQAFMWTATGCGPLCGGSGIAIFTHQSDGSWCEPTMQA